MEKSHAARITWSDARVRQGLWQATSRIVPTWFDRENDDGWSLVCEFAEAPVLQGTPSMAQVHFWVEAAPHERLVAGARLQPFDESGELSTVEVLD